MEDKNYLKGFVMGFLFMYIIVLGLILFVERGTDDNLCALLSNGEYVDSTQTKPNLVYSITCRDKNTNVHKRIFFNDLIVLNKYE